jgi:hypothetical protein
MEDFLGFRSHLYDVFQYRVINYVLIINYVTYTVCPYTYKTLITPCPLYKPPNLFFFALFRNISPFDLQRSSIQLLYLEPRVEHPIYRCVIEEQ